MQLIAPSLLALLLSSQALATTKGEAVAGEKSEAAAGEKLYATHCAACHGAERAGIAPTFPALIDVGKRLDGKQIKEKIRKGGGLMPPFAQLSEKDVEDIAVFLKK